MAYAAIATSTRIDSILSDYYYSYHSTGDNCDIHSKWWQQCKRYHRRKDTDIYMYYRPNSSCCLGTVVYWWTERDQSATPHTPQEGFGKFILSSSLVYKCRDVDHNKAIFCEAVNIEGRPKMTSTEMSLNILCKFMFLYFLCLINDHCSVNLIE